MNIRGFRHFNMVEFDAEEEAREEMANSMLQDGMSLDRISNYTKLPLETLQTMQQELGKRPTQHL